MSLAGPQDEKTPLFQRNNVPGKPTPVWPVPKAQFYLPFLPQLAEPITSYFIGP